MPIPFIALAAVGIVGAIAAAGVTAVVTHELSGDDAVVVRVVDGDTLDVEIDGATQRVRLLNVDAPENNKATGVTECLGAEATAELARLLPAGADVFLKYDDDRIDKYDRVLAGVYIDDTLVNAEMVRTGLAGSMLVGENDRFFEEVSAAEQEAFAAERGIYGTEVACTIGSIVSTYETQVTQAQSTELPQDSASLVASVAAAAALVAAADVAEDGIDAFTWVPEKLAHKALTALSFARLDATDFERTAQSALSAAQEREAAEAARIAAEQEAARVAAEKAAADAAAAEAARQAAARQSGGSSSGGSSGSSSGGGSTGGGGYDGYTGCRAYGSGGTSIDEKGRPYMKIDCTTKQPIG